MRADPIVATLVAVSALAVIDGDTFRIGAECYRLLGIDAAEIHRAQCDAERRLGELTKRRLEALAGSGDVDLRADRPGAERPLWPLARAPHRQWRGRRLHRPWR